jgi:FKBP-type peptidyl-prolyl cis-trans isomerase
MKNKYLFVTIFLVALVAVGGYFVFKIPSPVSEESLQNTSISDNIDTVDSNTLGAETSAASQSSTTTMITTNTDMNDKLEILDEVIGTGAEAVAGKSITVNYLGTLTNGTKFDSSYDRNQPFTFNLGAGEVIAGWDQGFAGMKVGGKRKLTIPPSMGYGAADMGAIPPNSTLVFEVELLEVK